MVSNFESLILVAQDKEEVEVRAVEDESVFVAFEELDAFSCEVGFDC